MSDNSPYRPQEAPCDACTGDGGRGHTMRGACAGAPCPGECGQRRYQCVCDENEHSNLKE